jgi:hypothetical protein
MDKIEYIFKLEEGVERPCITRNIQGGVNFQERQDWHYHLDGWCDANKFNFHIDILKSKDKLVTVMIHPN